MTKKPLGAKKVANERPCEILSAIRKRAGLSAADVGRVLQMKSPSAYPRYENPTKMGDRLLPEVLIKQLIPVFVGRGMPPIRVDELLAISERKTVSLSHPSTAIVTQTASSGLRSPVMFTSAPSSNINALVVRVEARKGVYVEADFSGANYGRGPMLPSCDFPIEAQFCVAVADDHAAGFGYPRGTALHCCFPDQFGPAALTGRKVVLWMQRETTGLGEMVVTKFKQTDAADWLCEDALGKDVRGRPVGVVVGSMRRE